MTEGEYKRKGVAVSRAGFTDAFIHWISQRLKTFKIKPTKQEEPGIKDSWGGWRGSQPGQETVGGVRGCGG